MNPSPTFKTCGYIFMIATFLLFSMLALLTAYHRHQKKVYQDSLYGGGHKEGSMLFWDLDLKKDSTFRFLTFNERVDGKWHYKQDTLVLYELLEGDTFIHAKWKKSHPYYTWLWGRGAFDDRIMQEMTLGIRGWTDK